jgi:CheY-like chemotaxis protein
MARGGFFSVDSLSGVHVLLVGPELAGRDVLAAVLRYCGALVTPASSAAAALDVMRQVKADVVLTEMDLPGADGLWLLRQLRARKPEDGGVVPVVALIPRGDPMTAEQARAAGFDGSMFMPVDPWALCRLIASLVNAA